MLTIANRAGKVCRGPSRRRMLEAAGAGLLGLSLPRVLQAEELRGPHPSPRARSVIFLFLFGGPSQLETFDLKPDAPSTVRGPLNPIPCSTEGLLISEGLPRLAALSHLYCVIRTMTHDFNDHSGGAHYLQTGRRWHIPIGGGFNATPQDWPAIGAVVEHQEQQRAGARLREVPAYAVIPNRLGHLEQQGQYVRPGEYAGWLGGSYNPLTTRAGVKHADTDNPYWRACPDEELTFHLQGQASRQEVSLDRLHRRRSLLGQLDIARARAERSLAISGGDGTAFDGVQRRALGLVCSDRTRRALDITAEPPTLRERYGRHLFGQSCLMARRLVEAGLRFVTVHYEACDGYSWDSHLHSNDVRDHLLPTTDQAAAALIADLHDRGMLDETLVVMLGEMGRTPRANGNWGRDHWSTLFPALLAGGGIRRGAWYGRSDEQAAYPLEDAVSPEDLAATLYLALGIDPELELPDREGRPIRLVQGGTPVRSLFD